MWTIRTDNLIHLKKTQVPSRPITVIFALTNTSNTPFRDFLESQCTHNRPLTLSPHATCISLSLSLRPSSIPKSRVSPGVNAFQHTRISSSPQLTPPSSFLFFLPLSHARAQTRKRGREVIALAQEALPEKTTHCCNAMFKSRRM